MVTPGITLTIDVKYALPPALPITSNLQTARHGKTLSVLIIYVPLQNIRTVIVVLPLHFQATHITMTLHVIFDVIEVIGGMVEQIALLVLIMVIAILLARLVLPHHLVFKEHTSKNICVAQILSFLDRIHSQQVVNRVVKKDYPLFFQTLHSQLNTM